MLSPLPERMRPRSFSHFAGQQHLLGEGKVLRQLIETAKVPSLLFWGPPGVGKTSLARFIAEQVSLPYFSLSAIDSGVKEVREVIRQASESSGALLFIDEIHRFNKAQQDALLGAVEKGIITLIGATTENPSFEVISALLSRCQVYVLQPLEKEDLIFLVERAIREDVVLSEKKIEVAEYEALLRYSGGDGRKLLHVLELTVSTLQPGENVIDNNRVKKCVQQRMALYDKDGEQHYDIISAFIKAMRGSDPNAAVYYLARMIQSGEDPVFIARRMLILASEDIGNANPNALLLAKACFDTVSVLGYPECRIVLSQTAIYLASSPKSNASYLAIDEALDMLKETGDLPVPLPLRNAPTKLMKRLDYGKEYHYAHSYEGNFYPMEFMPEGLSGKVFYQPGNNAREDEMRRNLRKLWKDKYGY